MMLKFNARPAALATKDGFRVNLAATMRARAVQQVTELGGAAASAETRQCRPNGLSRSSRVPEKYSQLR